MGRLTDALNFAIARGRLARLLNPVGLEPSEIAQELRSDEPNPALLRLYFKFLFWGWSGLTTACLLVAVGLAFVGDKIDGNTGNGIGAGIGFAPVGATLVGELDAILRQRYARLAERRFIAAGRVMDQETIRLIRIARRNHGTLLVQAVAGIAVGVVAGVTIAG